MADELDPRARALLAAYRSEGGPSPAATERLLASVRRSAAETGEAQVLPLRRRSHSRQWIGVAVVGLVAAAVALAVKLSPRRLDADAGTAGSAAALHAGGEAPGESVTSRPRRSASGETTTASAEPTPEPESEPPLQRPASPSRESPAPRIRDGAAGDARGASADNDAAPATSATPASAAPGEAPAGVGPEPAGDALARELAVMRAINDALAAGAPEQALTRIDEYLQRFPAGALGEEAAALRAVALCAAGRAGAAAAEAFLRAHPGSLSAERVRRACAAG